MFETAELGQHVSQEIYDQRIPKLRESLLIAQNRLQSADFQVIVVFAGVDGAGKGESVNLLNQWLDPRWIRNCAFDEPTQDELERPEYWRFWRALPNRGSIGILSSTWYSRPLVDRVFGIDDEARLESRLDEIRGFERTLANDGALFLKFWLHLGRDAQENRFRELSDDPLNSWRVSETDWEHWRRFDDFVEVGGRIINRTSTGRAPWHIIEGWDECYRGLRVGELLLSALEDRLDRWDEERLRIEAAKQAAPETVKPKNGKESKDAEANKKENGKTNGKGNGKPNGTDRAELSVLSTLDLSKKLTKDDYREQLVTLQGRLNGLQRKMREVGATSVMAFEGWDAAGKGGAIRRITDALDSRSVHVRPVAAPTDEELAQHYLWRFWRHVPRAGHIAIFDRSWYGRVLVERVEGFASDDEWHRAYAEINGFEEQLVHHGTVLLKFFIYIDPDEQAKRFKQRLKIPYKRHKMTDEDLRNRERWGEYETAVHDMVEQTSTRTAPWVLIEGNDKRFARIKVLKTICERLEEKIS
jgi:polyphosphate kinase 2 (PPK2 family)